MFKRLAALALAGWMTSATGYDLTTSGPGLVTDWNGDGYSEVVKYLETVDTETGEVIDAWLEVYDTASRHAYPVGPVSGVTELMRLDTPDGSFLAVEHGNPRRWSWMEYATGSTGLPFFVEVDPPTGDGCEGYSYGEACQPVPVEPDAAILGKVIGVAPCWEAYGCETHGRQGFFRLIIPTDIQDVMTVAEVRVFNPYDGSLWTILTSDATEWNCEGPSCTWESGWCERRPGESPPGENNGIFRWEAYVAAGGNVYAVGPQLLAEWCSR